MEDFSKYGLWIEPYFTILQESINDIPIILYNVIDYTKAISDNVKDIKESTNQISKSNQELLDKTNNDKVALNNDIQDIKVIAGKINDSNERIASSNQELVDQVNNSLNQNITTIWQFILKNIELFTIWGIFGALLIGLEALPNESSFKTLGVITSTLAFLFISYKILIESFNIKISQDSIVNFKMDFVEFIIFVVIFISFIIGVFLLLGNPVSADTAIIMYIYYIIFFIILIIILLSIMFSKKEAFIVKGIATLFVIFFVFLVTTGIIFIINYYAIHNDKLNYIAYIINMAVLTDFQIAVVIASIPLLFFIIKDLSSNNNLQLITNILNSLPKINWTILLVSIALPIVIILLIFGVLWLIIVPIVHSDPITTRLWNNSDIGMNLTFYRNNTVHITYNYTAITGQWNRLNDSYYNINTPVLNSLIGERHYSLIYLNNSENKSIYFIDNPRQIFNNATERLVIFNTN